MVPRLPPHRGDPRGQRAHRDGCRHRRAAPFTRIGSTAGGQTPSLDQTVGPAPDKTQGHTDPGASAANLTAPDAAASQEHPRGRSCLHTAREDSAADSGADEGTSRGSTTDDTVPGADIGSRTAGHSLRNQPSRGEAMPSARLIVNDPVFTIVCAPWVVMAVASGSRHTHPGGRSVEASGELGDRRSATPRSSESGCVRGNDWVVQDYPRQHRTRPENLLRSSHVGDAGRRAGVADRVGGESPGRPRTPAGGGPGPDRGHDRLAAVVVRFPQDAGDPRH